MTDNWTCSHGHVKAEHWVDGYYSCPHFRAPAAPTVPSADAMRSSPDDSEPVFEVARWLLAEAQPHVDWDTAGPEVQQHFIDRAVAMFAACPSLAVRR